MATTTPVWSNNTAQYLTKQNGTNDPTIFTGVDPIPIRQQYWFKVLICSLYGVIFIFGITGNSAVIFIIHRRKKLKTVTNLLILNLAISDLIFSGSIPFEIPLILEDFAWPYAPFFCKVYSPIQTIAVAVSIFTLTAVSCIRYRAIITPLRRQISHCVAKYILMGIWIFAGMLIIPHFVTLKAEGNECFEEWPNLLYRKTYTTILFGFFYVVPLFIIVSAYSKIVKELKKKKTYQNATLDEIRAEESRKVIRMLIKVTILFAVCNLPSQVMWLWLDFGEADKTIVFFYDLLVALNILIFANSAANPLCYYLYHDKFREEVRGYLRRIRKMLRRLKFNGESKHQSRLNQRLHPTQGTKNSSTYQQDDSLNLHRSRSTSTSNRLLCSIMETHEEDLSQV